MNTAPLPTDSRQDFCLALKAAREQKGISLSEIEKATKIPAYLFAALEQNDLSRWPTGFFFRRSFFRDYIRMVGLPVTEACAAFVQLFMSEERPAEVPEESEQLQGGSTEAPAARPWVTDARRVGPRRSQGFRVRIKIQR